MTLINKNLFAAVILSVSAGFITVEAQNSPAQEAPRRVNFGYSQNPKTKSRTQIAEIQNKPLAEDAAASLNSQPEFDNSERAAEKTENLTVAAKTLEVAKRSAQASVSPTEIYRVGTGDVLFVSLLNAPSKASTYFTVLGDGTIDFPLANGMVSVVGLTTEEIEDTLKEKIKLYENPQITVKVRENASHAISVLGLVEKAGEKFLQREAVPLYVVKAEAVVQPRANQVSIKRATSQNETVDLQDAKSDDVLIFPGDIVEFKAVSSAVENAAIPQFHYIGGEIISAGQKDFHQGLTLTQAIFASGGLRKSNVKKVVIRRKNEQGLLSPIEFDLNAVKNGKQPDPLIQAGDTIEAVKN